MHGRTALLLVSAFFGVAGATQAAPQGRHVTASLVAETDGVQAGQILVVGLRLQMDAGWHTYWRNPGDAGLPTRAKWNLPVGFAAGELQWPRPMRFNTGPLVSYGYEHEVLLPVVIQVPAELPSDQVRLTARVSWLECEEVCLPGKADLSLTLRVRTDPPPSSAAGLFQKTRTELPREDPAWRASATSADSSIALAVSPPRGTTFEEAYFYPFTRRVLDYSKPQALHSSGQGYRLELSRHPRGKTVDRLQGVLVGRTPRGAVAIQIDVPLAPLSSAATDGLKAPAPPGSR